MYEQYRHAQQSHGFSLHAQRVEEIHLSISLFAHNTHITSHTHEEYTLDHGKHAATATQLARPCHQRTSGVITLIFKDIYFKLLS